MKRQGERISVGTGEGKGQPEEAKTGEPKKRGIEWRGAPPAET